LQLNWILVWQLRLRSPWLLRFPLQPFVPKLTPLASSSWFGIITQRAIRRGSFSSVKELIAKIEQFVAAYNKSKAPFNWSATADSILEKLQRLCSQISGTAH
jgi:hypothetical protein